MTHRMRFVGYRDGREHWRGTGFGGPGSMTLVDDPRLRTRWEWLGDLCWVVYSLITGKY